ncbi:hypothetical protein GCM10028808_74650 [Spirosoma migulaei]
MESFQEPIPVDKPDPMASLTERQKRFVLAYVEYGVGARAAREAGYAEKNARVEAAKVLRKPAVKAALSALMEEYAMSAGEAIGRMSIWGRGSMEPFLSETGDIDLLSDQARQSIGLIKKYKCRKSVTKGPDDFVTETTTVEIELYDAKDATDKMIQIYGRYKQVPGDANQPKQLQSYTLPDGSVIVF